eukprot:TRINITY_DN8039_c0_g2_i5.p1 TRINITY_DN8039_c0_g2~~TRINITY_DN8039_c0_g2_i5.p1  ORF type:complete len:346 (-),score=93.70 TRINITY_DN8039_c0_g2_i5:35-1072(-)
MPEGPKKFIIDSTVITRTDFQVKNKRGLRLECSYFSPVKRFYEEPPCVIYLHGNCSSRMEALPAVEVLLPSKINLVCFDFAGCGLSEGEYISLGYYEKDDLECVIDYIRAKGWGSTMGIWGRSMGAATALLHAPRDPCLAGMVVDSAFANLRQLAEELAKKHANLPGFVFSGAISVLKKSIQSRANFNIEALSPIDHVKEGFVPAMFIAGKQDAFIEPHHTKKLYEEYAGDKTLSMVDGDHNSPRPHYTLDAIAIFFYQRLQCEHLAKVSEEVREEESKVDVGAVEHFQAYRPRKIGNEEEVGDVVGYLGGEAEEEELRKAIEMSMNEFKTVSYTHLTLPTIYSV